MDVPFNPKELKLTKT